MRLYDVINLMYIEGTATVNTTITIKEYGSIGRTFYKGTLKKFKEYIESHENLSASDGFKIPVMRIKEWHVVEILVDRSNPEEQGIPDYNKGKIIVIT